MIVAKLEIIGLIHSFGGSGVVSILKAMGAGNEGFCEKSRWQCDPLAGGCHFFLKDVGCQIWV